MDANKRLIIQKKIEKTILSLKKNKMDAFYVENKKALLTLLPEMMKADSEVTVGGSMTLFEAGVIEHLRSGRYRFLDRYKEGLTPEQIREVFVKSFASDVFLCSSNAVTEEGELYNVDGNGNRVAAMLFGPKNVIVIVGYNKIVGDVEQAKLRVESVAAPANNKRLNINNPCVTNGQCMNCQSESRICCSHVIMGMQREPNRVKVIIVGEELGY